MIATDEESFKSSETDCFMTWKKKKHKLPTEPMEEQQDITLQSSQEKQLFVLVPKE